MRLRFAALLVLLAASTAFAQEQPTAQQCRADREAWGALKGEEIVSLSFDEVERRETEMDKCAFVDQFRGKNYGSLSAAFEREKGRRWFRFIDRHGYWKQFLQEDDHGER